MTLRLVGAVLPLAFTTALLAQDAPTSSWSISSGPGVLIVPEYSGSDEYRVLPLPITEVSYRNRIYMGRSRTGMGSAFGAYAIRNPRLGLAVEIGAQPNRKATRADALAGMENLEWVGSGGASLSYRRGPLEGSIGVLRGFNDGAGTLGSVTIALDQQFGRFLTNVGLGATFADADQMRRDFGVTTTEATRRQALIAAGDGRLRADEGNAYRPDGGLRHVSASLSMMYLLSRRWSLASFGGVDGLSVDAQESPVVRRRDQYWGGVGLAYRFF